MVKINKSIAVVICCILLSIVALSLSLPRLGAKAGELDGISILTGYQPPGQSYWILAIGGSGRDYAPSFHETDDGYVVVGMTSSYGYGDGGGNKNGSHDFMVVKLDKEGHHLWNRVIGGPQDERGSYSVRPTADGGFLLTGTTRSFGAGKADIFIVKLNGRGDLEWSRAVGGPGAEAGMTTLETADGYITLGDSDSFWKGGKDLLVVKLNHDGNLVWARTYGGIRKDTGSGIARMDGGYLIGGTFWSFGAGEADAGLIKINALGDVIWAKTVGGTAGEGINWDGVRVTSDNGVIFGDRTGSFGAKGNGAMFGIKLSSAGKLEWSTMIDGPAEDVGWTMNETEDGYIAGGKFTLPKRGGDIFVVKFDKKGNYLWSRLLGKDRLDEIEEIRPTQGGYVMTGVTRMVDPAGDFLVAKVDTHGFVGGAGDPIIAFHPRDIFSINPRVQSFRPKVIDVTEMITVKAVNPKVISASIKITEIHRNK